jgi:hypothetical protein
VVECPREADLTELRRAVDGLVRQAAPARFGGERDHVGCVALEEVRQGSPDRVQRALQVRVDHLLEMVT